MNFNSILSSKLKNNEKRLIIIINYIYLNKVFQWSKYSLALKDSKDQIGWRVFHSFPWKE